MVIPPNLTINIVRNPLQVSKVSNFRFTTHVLNLLGFSNIVALGKKLYATAILNIYPGPELIRPINKLSLRPNNNICHTNLQIHMNVYTRCHNILLENENRVFNILRLALLTMFSICLLPCNSTSKFRWLITHCSSCPFKVRIQCHLLRT